jgi:hypothetical protein
MPFTLAHPAAAIPCRQYLGSWGVSTAVVIGSIVPDFSYFIPLPIDPTFSHSLIGLVLFCLPLGVLSYFLFYLLVAPLAYALLPLPNRGRLSTTWAIGKVPTNPPVGIVVSLLVGAITHLVWDSFTHSNGAIVALFPSLATPLFDWEGYTLFVYGALQHTSTILGLALLFWWSVRWKRKAASEKFSTVATKPVCIPLLIALLGPPGAIGLASGYSHLDPGVGALRQLQMFLGNTVYSGGSSLMIWGLVVGAVWRISKR